MNPCKISFLISFIEYSGRTAQISDTRARTSHAANGAFSGMGAAGKRRHVAKSSKVEIPNVTERNPVVCARGSTKRYTAGASISTYSRSIFINSMFLHRDGEGLAFHRYWKYIMFFVRHALARATEEPIEKKVAVCSQRELPSPSSVRR